MCSCLCSSRSDMTAYLAKKIGCMAIKLGRNHPSQYHLITNVLQSENDRKSANSTIKSSIKSQDENQDKTMG